MPIALKKNHLKYMNIGERYWKATRESLNPEQSKCLNSYLSKLDDAVRRGIGLFLWGPNNTGKSYVSALLCKMVWAQHRVTSYCVTAAELKESWIHETPAHADSEELMSDRVALARFLVIDDLGREYRSNSGFSEVHFGALLRQRVRENLVTCITTNLSPKEFTETYGKATSNLVKECMYPIHLVGPDMRDMQANNIKNFLEG